MPTTSALFTPVRLGPLTLPNRIMVSPMCQYSAVEGLPVDWHLIHLGSLAISGAGLLCVEATAVRPEGRITPGCLGLYSDGHQAGLHRVVQAVRSVSSIPLAIQLSHAGRKASSRAPWEGGTLIAPGQGGWEPLAPSALPQRPDEPPPRAMTTRDIADVIESFAQAAERARELGFDAIELHMAHGYLLHQFMSPLANARDDAYGGSLDNRLRLPLQVFDAVAQAAGPGIAVGVRLSATDWVEGGWDIAQTIEMGKRLQARGCAFLDISSGGVSYQQKIPLGPGYQVAFAERIRREAEIATGAVGLITDAVQADTIVRSGQADVILLAREYLRNPYFTLEAAHELGREVEWPVQYVRGKFPKK